MSVSREDIEALRREKYANDPSAYMSADITRLASGEPLAYVIGTLPFLGLSIHLDSHPLIPRPETEWWTELLIEHINTTPRISIYGNIESGGESPKDALHILDLCAGSGAIGLAILAHCPKTQVSFGEIEDAHLKTIRKNSIENHLDATRTEIHSGNLFEPFQNKKFHIVASNPPYIPDTRPLEESVSGYEPSQALYAGVDGLAVIERILTNVRNFLLPKGELWMECDIENIEKAQHFALTHGAVRCEIHTDPYGRPRLLVAYY
jgi:release factor glutamine methyltransferase